jgi:hypothetical protein
MIAQGINTMKMYEQKISLNYPFQEKDIIWNRAGIIEWAAALFSSLQCPILPQIWHTLLSRWTLLWLLGRWRRNYYGSSTALSWRVRVRIVFGCIRLWYPDDAAGVLLLSLRPRRSRCCALPSLLLFIFFSWATSTSHLPSGDCSLPSNAPAKFDHIVVTSSLRYLLLGTFSAIIGQYILAVIMQKYRKESLILFLIIFTFVLGGLGLGTRGIMAFVADVQVMRAEFPQWCFTMLLRTRALDCFVRMADLLDFATFVPSQSDVYL